MAIDSKVRIEEIAPIHATVAPVRTLHKTVPVMPSGWVKVSSNKTFGAINVA